MDVFEIPSVLEKVLAHLETKYVTLYRLVNSNWNIQACKILQSRVEIQFRNAADLTKYNAAFQSSLPSISIVFKNFHFSSSVFISALEDNVSGNLRKVQDEIETFVKLAGSQVTQLKLVVCPVLPLTSGTPRYTTVMFTEMLKMIYNRFPNLENIKLLFIASPIPIKIEEDDLAFQTTELVNRYSKKVVSKLRRVQFDLEISSLINDQPLEHRLIRAFIKTLLTTATNLECISTQAYPPDVFLQECLLNSLPFMSPSINFKEIPVRLPMTAEYLHLWTTLNFLNLNTVHFEIESTSTVMPALEKFLARYSSSLQKIHLAISGPSTDKQFMNFPLGVSMDKLESLTLEQLEGSLDWARLPALKHLKLQNSSYVRIAYSFMASSEISRASVFDSLEITEGTQEGEEDFLNAFTKFAPCALPRLTTLTVTNIPFPLPFAIIFAKCIQLKRLTIQKCGEITDPVLCGMRPSLIDAICPVEPPQDSGSEILDKAFQKMVTLAKSSGQTCAREFPFIGNLKELQFLTMEGRFSDAGVLYGIISCNKLVKLSLKSEFCTWRSSRMIQQANLLHLTGAVINGSKVNFSGGLRDP